MTTDIGSLLHMERYIKAFQGLLSKSDGRDKLLAAMQYAAMFASAGAPGAAQQVQKSFAGARKPFRVLKPIDSIMPLLIGPAKKGAFPVVLLDKIKMLAFFFYFGADHIVWAGSTGLVKDKATLERAGKVSMYGWLTASLAALCIEAIAVGQTEAKAAKEKKEESCSGSQEALSTARFKHALSITNSCTQVAVASALLGLVPMKPRTIASLGVLTSCISMYTLAPALPPLPAKAKPA